jgi:tetratricopeptide (TPR) repeat protein
VSKFSFRLLLLVLFACGRKDKYLVNPQAKLLNDSAASFAMHFDYIKAIDLLDQATKLDSNYFNAYQNKLAFLGAVKQYVRALETVKELIRLRPNIPDFYVTAGVLYEQLGDTVESVKYFKTALVHFDNVLDTMTKQNQNYNMLNMSKSLTIILSGEEEKGTKLLRQNYNNLTDTLLKESMTVFIGKSRQEILDGLKNPEKFFPTKVEIIDH